MRYRLWAAIALACLTSATVAQMGFVNYETAHVHPLRVSPDGSRLFVVNAPAALLEVYSLANPEQPLLLKQIPVGLEPTSVALRSNDEAWVVCSLSDAVNVVSVREGRVTASLRTSDEPYDLAFAGSPVRAFVSCATDDRVEVFDVATKTLVATVPVFGNDPRAVVADPSGQRVFVLAHRSGNKTTILRRDMAPAPPAPTNPMLMAPPQVGLIVAVDDPAYAPSLAISLPDDDVFEIDAASYAVTRTFKGVGTTLYDVAVDPANGDLVVANTEARNLVRFEPNLRGHVVDSRVTRIATGMAPQVTPIDLNPGLDYATLPNAAAKAIALSEPTALAVAGGEVFVAAQGTDRIGVLSPNGQVLARIALGTGASTLSKRGPRGLAAHPFAPRLYVFNKLSASVSIVDTQARAVVGEFDLAYDPTPMALKNGRRFLYDAMLSGNGTASCASCHLDGDIDGLAWDLGDPNGAMMPTPMQPPPFNAMLPPSFHPMKGPLLTQSLRGLAEIAPFHWRGDRATLDEFNMTFSSLLGGTPLGVQDLAMFTSYLMSIRFHPNPNQTIMRAFASFPPGNNALDGFDFFFDTVVTFNSGSPATCSSCHEPPAGTNGMIVAPGFLFDTQPFRIAPVRNSYRRTGTSPSGPSKSGFGFGHDGSFATLAEFLQQPEFMPWPVDQKDDLETYMLSIDTGTAQTVGYGFVLDDQTAAAAVDADFMILEAQMMVGNCDVVAHGRIDGVERGLLYDMATASFMTDQPGVGPFSFAALKQKALIGNARIQILGVSPMTGMRHAIDRDMDGIPNGIDGLAPYGVPSSSTLGDLFFSGNREPRVGESGFAFIASNTPTAAAGIMSVSAAALDEILSGVSVYIDYRQPGYLVLPVAADGDGLLAYPAPLPNAPALAGFALYLQVFVFDPQATGSPIVASNGLAFVIQP